MSKNEPNLIKAYTTFDNQVVVINENSFIKLLEKYEGQENIPDTEIIETQVLELEKEQFTAVYEVVAEGKTYKLKDMIPQWVRCSNI